MDKIYYNGNIYALDKKGSRYTAIGTENGKIAFLGTDEEAAAINADQREDLKGRTVLPGFVDSHLHMLNYAFVKKSYEMFDACSIEEVVAKTQASTGCGGCKDRILSLLEYAKKNNYEPLNV